jgi:hypothetical protein
MRLDDAVIGAPRQEVTLRTTVKLRHPSGIQVAIKSSRASAREEWRMP